MGANIVLLADNQGRVLLGTPTPFGVIGLLTFDSYDELRKFAMGVLGFAEYMSPEVPIPQYVLDAFKEDK